MSEINDIVERNLAEQKQEEQKLFRELKRAYQEVERGLMDEADKLLGDDENTLLKRQRVNELTYQVRGEMQKYADDYVVPRVAEGMVQSSFMGSTQASDVLKSISSPVTTTPVLPVLAIEEATRFLTTGPLGTLFASFGDRAADRARAQLMTSLALGHNPRKTARLLKKTLGVNRNRALLIARTETMRAHREGSRKYYKNNGVEKWVWHAAASSRTCAACWALHGQEFDIDERMGAHPACRCTMVPKPQTWRQMGYNIDGDSIIEDGETMFAQQSESTQQAVLGSQYKRYKQGEVKLEDFVVVKTSPYGKTYTKTIPK